MQNYKQERVLGCEGKRFYVSWASKNYEKAIYHLPKEGICTSRVFPMKGARMKQLDCLV